MNTPERFKLIVSPYLLLIKENKILLLRRQNTGYEDGNYGLVSGHHDGNEPLTHAMAREAREESGLILDPKELQLAFVLHRISNDERIDFFFTANHWSGTPTNTEPDKCSDLSWFPLTKLPKNTIPYIRFVIEHYQAGEFYAEHGW